MGNRADPRWKQDSGHLLTVAAAAQRLALSPCTIRAWITARRIGAVRLGRALRVPEHEVERLLREGYLPAGGQPALNADEAAGAQDGTARAVALCAEPGDTCARCAEIARACTLTQWHGLLTGRAVVEAAVLRRAGIKPTESNLALALADWLADQEPNPLADRQRYPDDADAAVRCAAREAANNLKRRGHLCQAEPSSEVAPRRAKDMIGTERAR